jgi:hypothetical protein
MLARIEGGGVRLGAGVAIALTLSLGLGGRSVMAGTYTLSITGDPGASFAGACTVYKEAAEERVALAGPVPLERSFTGAGLACRLEAEGRVVVEVAGGGSRSRSATSGGTINVTLR